MFEDSPSQPSSPSGPKSNFKVSGVFSKLPQVFGVVILVLALGAAGFFFIQYQNEKSKAAQLLGANTSSPEEIKKLVEIVGKLIELPSGEQPTVATVSNKEKLSGQAFFEKAQNGDKVLIYEKARVAIIYRPSSGKVINYATNITVGDQAATNPEPTGGADVTPSVSPTAEPTSVPFVPQSTVAPTSEPTIAPVQ